MKSQGKVSSLPRLYIILTLDIVLTLGVSLSIVDFTDSHPFKFHQRN